MKQFIRSFVVFCLAATANAGMTMHLKLDCHTGVRAPSPDGEVLRYDASWYENGEEVRITENGVVSTDNAGAEDPQVKTKIDTANYYDFRDWAGKVKTPGGDDAGVQAVMAARNAWLSYALGQEKLLEAVPTDADLAVEAFEPATETAKFDFTVAVGTIEVGSEAAKESLKKVFGLEGAETLEGEAFSSENVEIEFGEPQGQAIRDAHDRRTVARDA